MTVHILILCCLVLKFLFWISLLGKKTTQTLKKKIKKNFCYPASFVKAGSLHALCWSLVYWKDELESHCKESMLIQHSVNVLLTVLYLGNFAGKHRMQYWGVLGKRRWVVGQLSWNRGHFLTSVYQRWKCSDQRDTTSKEILAKSAFASMAQKHTEFGGLIVPLCISECMALLYLDCLSGQCVSLLNPCPSCSWSQCHLWRSRLHIL